VVDRATGAVSVSRPLQRDQAAVVRLTVKVTDVSAATLQEGTGIYKNKLYHYYFSYS
jgi:hypothetical protein